MTRQIPNIFTLLNLFFGCIAIVFILQTESLDVSYAEDGYVLNRVPQMWWYGSLFILIAAVVDFLDGFVARFLNATSELGKQLDSLADVVSFGVAPSLILYQFLRFSVMQQPNGMNASIVWLVPAFVLACAGAYRLGKYNISIDQTKYFTGVPIPAIGLVVASFPLILETNTFGWANILLNKWVLYIIIFVLSWLMVCKYKMLSLKFNIAELKNQLPLLLIFIIAALSFIFIKWFAVPLIFIAYVILSLLQQNKMKA